MATYTKQQLEVIREINQVARQRYSDPHERAVKLKSAYATGIVETHLTNVKGGDADSSGWRQERGSLYKDPNNLSHSVHRYFDEADKIWDGKMDSASLAALVQRPAAQYAHRYGDKPVAAEAQALLHGKVSGGSAAASSAKGTMTTGKAPTVTPGETKVDTDSAVVDALLSHRGGSLLKGIMSNLDSGRYTTETDPKVTAGTAPKYTPGKTVSATSANLSSGKSDGKVSFAPGANRSGVAPTSLLMTYLDHLSGFAGEPLKVGTGTNHSQMTTSGNQSDHWTGNGADIPYTGAKLTQMGRKALIAYGMSPAKAAKAAGGIYNLQYKGHRVQVIFNTTEGGNHWNHLHIGVR